MKFIIGICFLLGSAAAWSCSCWGQAPIETAIIGYPILVEGEVVAVRLNEAPDNVVLKVSRVFKGSIESEEVVVVLSQCSASLYPEMMQVGHTYVLPLNEPYPALPPRGEPQPIFGRPGAHEMAQCSHSGLERIDNKLYTFEHDGGPAARLQYYAPYPAFRWCLPLVMAMGFGFTILAALDQLFALSPTLLALSIGTAGVYFALKYPYWFLGPVLVLAAVIFLLQVASLLFQDRFEHGSFYWALSWATPAIVIGAGILGRRMRRRM